MTRRRGDTEPPHPDYLDTGRDHLAAPRNARTRPLRTLAGKTQKTGHPTATNEKGKTMISENTNTQAPEGFTAVHVPSLRGVIAQDLQGAIQVDIADYADRVIWEGPKHPLPLGTTIEQVWTPGTGLVARRADTTEILTAHCLRGAIVALHDAWDEITAHRGATEPPAGWTPAHTGRGPFRSTLPAFWRGPTFPSPLDAIPVLQARWTAASGPFVARTDNGGALTRGDVQGSLAGLREALAAIQGGGQR